MKSLLLKLALGVVLISATTPIGPIFAAEDSAITRGPLGPTGPQIQTGPTGVTGSHAENTILSNGQTGNESVTSNAATNSNATTATTTNAATTTNSVQGNLNTGTNTVNQNTQVGTVKTGDINGSVTVLNVANSSLNPASSVGSQTVNAGANADIALVPTNSRTALDKLENDQTGVNSTNQNTAQNSNAIRLNHLNSATANNELGITANTGGNSLNQNTEIGALKTGDINLAVNVLNLLNVTNPNLKLALDVWSVLSTNPNAVISVPVSNTQTGANSENTNTGNSSNATGITVDRAANATNTVGVKATTGGNTLTENSSAGDLKTGSTTINNNQVTIANTQIPSFYIFNVLGDWKGSIEGMAPNSYVINRLDNVQTGVQSTNSNQAATNTSLTKTVNQKATANNTVAINANTGGNTLTKNTVVGDVSTGSINVVSNLINILNSWGSNLKDFHLGIINIFGKSAPVSDKKPQMVPENVILTAQSEVPIKPEVITKAIIEGKESSTVFVPAAKIFNSATTVKNDTKIDFILAPDTTSKPKILASAKIVSTNPPLATQNQPSTFPWLAALIGLGLISWAGVEIASLIASRRLSR